MKLKNVARAFAFAAAAVLTAGTGLAYANVDVSGVSDTTGPFSANRNLYEIDKNWAVTVDNLSDLVNGVALDVNAGANDVDFNTTVEDIDGGDIDLSVLFDNELNTDDWSWALPSGNGDVDADFANDTTGPNSLNENIVDIEKNTAAAFLNTAEVSNDVAFDLNTGFNNVAFNTTVGDVTGGDIDVEADIRTEVNTSNMSQFSSDLGSMDGDVNVDFGNQTTGPNSENLNLLDLESNTTLTVLNQAQVSNDFDIAANSGGNTVSNNTTVGDVATGDITIDIVGITTAN